MNKREWMLQAALAIPQWDTHGSDDHVKRLSYLYDAICAASPETPQEGAWVEHDGDVSKAPSPVQRVEVTVREGKQSAGYGDDFDWDHAGDGMDIVRWRYA